MGWIEFVTVTVTVLWAALLARLGRQLTYGTPQIPHDLPDVQGSTGARMSRQRQRTVS